jgi:hypothetical protein
MRNMESLLAKPETVTAVKNDNACYSNASTEYEECKKEFCEGPFLAPPPTTFSFLFDCLLGSAKCTIVSSIQHVGCVKDTFERYGIVD